MPALLMRMSRDSTSPAAALICASLVTSRTSGVTRASGCARASRVPAYTRRAPLFRASLTSACPMPRLAPVTRTVLPVIVISAPCRYGPSAYPGSHRPADLGQRLADFLFERRLPRTGDTTDNHHAIAGAEHMADSRFLSVVKPI